MRGGLVGACWTAK